MSENEYPEIGQVYSIYAERKIETLRSNNPDNWREFAVYPRGDLASQVNAAIVYQTVQPYVNLGQAFILSNCGVTFLWETKNGNQTRIAAKMIELSDWLSADYCLDQDALSRLEYSTALTNIQWESRFAIGRELTLDESKQVYDWVSDQDDLYYEFEVNSDNGEMYFSDESIKRACVALTLPIESD